MKQSISFSIEDKVINNFHAIIIAKNMDRNETISHIINRFCKENVVETVTAITCSVCGEKYNSKLQSCPNCAKKELDNIEHEKSQAQENKVVEAANAIIIAQKAALEKELSQLNSVIIRFNDPQGTKDMPDEERKAKLQTFIEKANELRGKILDLEQA